MSSEITVQGTLLIQKGNLNYRSPSSGFRADMTGTGGFTPGQINVTSAGMEINLDILTTPGVGEITNLSSDSSIYLEYGIRDPDVNTFFPLGEVLSGETWPMRLSRHLSKQYIGTGTGNENNKQLWIRSVGGDCKAVCVFFEK